MRSNDLPQRELAEACGVSLRTAARWAAQGRLPRDPVTGRVIRTEAEQTMAPWARENRLRQLINSIPAGQLSLILRDYLRREYLAAVVNLTDDFPEPGADCDTGNVRS